MNIAAPHDQVATLTDLDTGELVGPDLAALDGPATLMLGDDSCPETVMDAARTDLETAAGIDEYP